MLGYMEQSVATALTKALTAVGCFKPKYPFVDAKKSALLYIAYHLKGTDDYRRMILPAVIWHIFRIEETFYIISPTEEYLEHEDGKEKVEGGGGTGAE